MASRLWASSTSCLHRYLRCNSLNRGVQESRFYTNVPRRKATTKTNYNAHERTNATPKPKANIFARTSWRLPRDWRWTAPTGCRMPRFVCRWILLAGQAPRAVGVKSFNFWVLWFQFHCCFWSFSCFQR